MRGWVLLLSTATLLLAGAASAGPPPTVVSQVRFTELEQGAVRPDFHARRYGNRVFYAGSLKQARRWVRFTRIPFNPVDFKTYGLLAIFYEWEWWAAYATPEPQWVEESRAGDLSAKITLQCAPCGYPAPPLFPQPWGIYIVLLIDKGSLAAPPKTLSVTTAFGF
jgi:hypothetical protein